MLLTQHTGIFPPDEHSCLVRYTVRSKVTHLLRTLIPPNSASQHIDRLHSELLNSHLNVCPQSISVSRESNQSFILSSPHLDVRKVASLPLASGGHGILSSFSHTRPTQPSNPPINQSESPLTHHHASFSLSWASTWSIIRAWMPPLRE